MRCKGRYIFSAEMLELEFDHATGRSIDWTRWKAGLPKRPAGERVSGQDWPTHIAAKLFK